MDEINRHRYDDIIGLPHPEPRERPRMSLHDRAAQFSPFAALTGYEGEIEEIARLTEKKRHLDDERKRRLDDLLRRLTERVDERPEVTVTYFLPDGRKEGGAYVTASGELRRIDEYARRLIFADGRSIPIRDIFEAEVWFSVKTADKKSRENT
ncbi:MAG: hypothetical protein NC084_01210 [Bacteroides sp.]|nr:hypothetical protein [Eubacterium sp.]MCM1417871.1 hypothetical protein [Roseburia sp.]MCM1461310.1 hypothetical protein [Bacteroides sp.]